MRTVRTVAEVRAAVAAQRADGGTVALVPTMGAFHDGHLALMRAARERAALVVVWLFVNPTQFNEASDLAAYPRDEARDAALAAAEGVDVLFAPPAEEVYPSGFATTITVEGLGDVLEGEHRPGHFAGVATVVAKMLNMVGPDVALFGAKDAQQVALVRRLVRDLDIPVRIETVDTVREPDGLALSSRNVHLAPDERERAVGLSRALAAAAEAVGTGERDAVRLRGAAEAVLRDHGVEPEYVAIVHPETFEPVRRVNGHVLVAVAARVGSTRLIDNRAITTQEANRVERPSS
ncbi:MAG TPA: pantoate--beta-alanine ligase [Solirubrobacteraceae bacterium]